MSHQVAYGDLVHRAVLAVYSAQLWQVLRDRIIKLQQAAITQLHDGDACERFSVRRPMIDRVLVNRLIFRKVGRTVILTCYDLVVSQKKEAAANNAGVL